jgi:hypothetical protein
MGDAPLEQTTESSPRPDATRPRLPHVPRLTILHLLVLTALTSAVMVVFTHGLGVSTTDPISVAASALSATGVAWIYLGGLLILRHAVHRTLWPLEPGEWLILLAINVLTILGLIGVAENFAFWRSQFSWLVLLIPAEFAVAALVPAITQRRRRIWSALFGVIALACIVFYGVIYLDRLLLLNLSYYALIATGLTYVCGFASLALGLLIAGIVTDWRRGESRRWLHWSAVVPAGMALIWVVGVVIVVIVAQLL